MLEHFLSKVGRVRKSEKFHSALPGNAVLGSVRGLCEVLVGTGIIIRCRNLLTSRKEQDQHMLAVHRDASCVMQHPKIVSFVLQLLIVAQHSNDPMNHLVCPRFDLFDPR